MNQGLFAGKTTVITGGAHGIGRAISDAFLREGADVHIIDIQPGDWFVGDVSKKEDLERFAADVMMDIRQGSRCLTSPQPLSQMDAALEAVRMIGLNQKEEVKKEWFSDPTQWEMFQRRHQMLVSAAK